VSFSEESFVKGQTSDLVEIGYKCSQAEVEQGNGRNFLEQLIFYKRLNWLKCKEIEYIRENMKRCPF
jgi:hypothetical protein